MRLFSELNRLGGLLTAAGILFLLASCDAYLGPLQKEYTGYQREEPSLADGNGGGVVGGVSPVVPTIPTRTVVRLNFSPLHGMTYDLDWPGPPRRPIRWQDTKLYYVEVELDRPAPVDMPFSFYVREDVSGWFDTELGFVSITIRKGRVTPMSQDIVGVAAGGGAIAPIGTPNPVRGGFYLGCTKKGKVKGNYGKNGRNANVFIEEAAKPDPRRVRVEWADRIRTNSTTGSGPGARQSPRHLVRCR